MFRGAPPPSASSVPNYSNAWHKDFLIAETIIFALFEVWKILNWYLSWLVSRIDWKRSQSLSFRGLTTFPVNENRAGEKAAPFFAQLRTWQFKDGDLPEVALLGFGPRQIGKIRVRPGPKQKWFGLFRWFRRRKKRQQRLREPSRPCRHLLGWSHQPVVWESQVECFVICCKSFTFWCLLMLSSMKSELSWLSWFVKVTPIVENMLLIYQPSSRLLRATFPHQKQS